MNRALIPGPVGPEVWESRLLERWYTALVAVEPSAVGAAALETGVDGIVSLAYLGALETLDDATVLAVKAASDSARVQVAPLKATGQALIAAPLKWAAHPRAIMVLLLDRSLAEAGQFAASFELSVARLASALAQPPKIEPPQPQVQSPPQAPPGFAADILRLLQAPDATAFAEAIFSHLNASLHPDSACLVLVRGSRIKLLRNSGKSDPLPRGGRVGHSRRVAILAAAAGERPISVSWAEAEGADRASLDLGLLARGEGPTYAASVTIPSLHGPGRLVFLAEYLDEDANVPVSPSLEAELDELAATIAALRGRTSGRRAADSKGSTPLKFWLPRAAVAVAVLGALVWLVLPAPRYITGEATVTSSELRSIVATRDGILAKVYFEPGQQVRQGDVIAEFDTHELRLSDNRLAAQLAQAEARKQSAVAGFNAAELRVIDAEIDSVSAERDLVALMLEQSVVTARNDAVILSGEMSERTGSALRKGELMFQLAPLSGYTVQIDVPQQDVSSVELGQEGRLKLTAMPFDDFPVRVIRVSPAANDASSIGAFTVRADLLATNPSLRPGLKGVAHLQAGETMRIWTLTRDFVFWLRMQVWRWIA